MSVQGLEHFWLYVRNNNKAKASSPASEMKMLLFHSYVIGELYFIRVDIKNPDVSCEMWLT